jgi:molybdate transport system substrate-binding protein
MTIRATRRAALLLAPLALPALARAQGAPGVEIHVISSGAFTAAYNALAPQFEQQTGHRLVSAFGASMGQATDAIPQRLARGEPADLLILIAEGVAPLERAGHVVPGSRLDLAESRIAFAVRAGEPLPDLSTLDSLRDALLAAPSIAYSASASGVYFETELVRRLGVADQVLPKSRRILSERVGAVVARGDAALGLQQVSELLPIPGIQVVRIAEAAQRVSVTTAALATRVRQPREAVELAEFLRSREAVEAVAATGLDPIRRG